MTAITLQNLSKSFHHSGRTVIRDLSLEIPKGSLTALLGPSGCGKTSLLKMISGIMPVTSGDILFGGRSVLKIAPERRGAAMMFQGGLLFPHMDVAANIGFGLRMRGLSATERDQRIQIMLQLVKLPDLGSRRPSELSGGQRSRVALARALVIDPVILLLDEPLAALDAHLRSEMRELIRNIQQKTGVTTLFVTHDQEEAVSIADNIALMLDGRIRQFGRPADFFERPIDRETARFFGGCNFVSGQVSNGVFTGQIGPLKLCPGIKDGAGIMTFRPESVAIASTSEAMNSFDCKLESKTYFGTRTRLLLSIGSVSIFADLDPPSAFQLVIGTTVRMSIPREALWMLGA